MNNTIMAYFNTVNTTTQKAPSLVGEPVVQGTPLFGSKESATTAVPEEFELDLSTRNINYINNQNKELDKSAFELALYANSALKNYTNFDGSKANGWYFGNRHEVQINTQDVWNTLTDDNKNTVINTYADYATRNTDKFFNLAIENNESNGSNSTIFDFQEKYYNYLDKKRHVEALYEKHNEYLRNAAVAVDGQYQSKGYGPLKYAQFMFDEKTGALVSESDYNNKINTRYNTLKRTAKYYEYAPAMYEYAEDLYLHYSGFAIPETNEAFTEFNKTLLSAFTQNREGGNPEQNFTNFLNTVLASNVFSKYDFSGTLEQLYEKQYFKNVPSDKKGSNIVAGRPESEYHGKIRVTSNKLFNEFLLSNGYSFDLNKDKQMLLDRISQSESNARSLAERNANPAAYQMIGQIEEDAERKIKNINLKQSGEIPLVSYQDFYTELDKGKEEQTYNKTYTDIITTYNQNPGGSFKALENRYQYLIDAGTGGVNYSMGINYNFNFKEAVTFDVKGEQGNANWLAGQSFFINLSKNLKDNSEDIKNNFLFSFDINPKSEVVSIDKSSTRVLGEEGNESKYITSVFIPKITSILQNPSNAGKIIQIERFNANRSTKRPEDLSENERNKIPRGDFIYRGQVSGEEMEGYEAYSFKFDPLFLNEYEADLKKIHFKTSKDDEESSNKIITDIFQRVRDNGITFFVKSDYAVKNEGFTPSKERKDAMEITGLEGAISDKGSVTRFFNRAGSIKIFKDDAANKWRISGNYLVLQGNGTYKKEPIPEKTFPIKAENGTIATPYDMSRIMKSYTEQFRFHYNKNTKVINYLIESGIDIPDDVYYNTGE